MSLISSDLGFDSKPCTFSVQSLFLYPKVSKTLLVYGRSWIWIGSLIFTGSSFFLVGLGLESQIYDPIPISQEQTNKEFKNDDVFGV